MKKIIYSLIIISSFIISCTQDNDTDELIMKSELSKNNSDKKMTICHKNAGTINISINALQAHLDHGDKITYSTEGSYTFRKITERPPGNIIIGDYFLDIGPPDENGDFFGTGIRYAVKTLYCNVVGNVDNDGNMSLKLSQWPDNPDKIGPPGNWYNLEGEVAECGGISEIQWISGKEGEHIFLLVTDE